MPLSPGTPHRWDLPPHKFRRRFCSLSFPTSQWLMDHSIWPWGRGKESLHQNHIRGFWFWWGCDNGNWGGGWTWAFINNYKGNDFVFFSIIIPFFSDYGWFGGFGRGEGVPSFSFFVDVWCSLSILIKLCGNKQLKIAVSATTSPNKKPKPTSTTDFEGIWWKTNLSSKANSSRISATNPNFIKC